ncbi:MAG TPA: hypothetical protein VGB74_06560 [Actinoplanes sp.]
MLITFDRAVGGSTIATIERRDGVTLALPGYDRKHRVPHDLAHAVTECELAMAGGVFGSIAGGGVFANMRVLAGRERHDARDRSKRLLAANKSSLGVAECVAGVVHAAVEHGATSSAVADARRSWGVFSAEPVPWTEPQLTAAISRLTVLAGDFARDGHLRFVWPDRLTSPVPVRVEHRLGRRGRV